jgi:glucan phosphoethanolaminetransferase (alkaline phosphatase superfamily)
VERAAARSRCRGPYSDADARAYANTYANTYTYTDT